MLQGPRAELAGIAEVVVSNAGHLPPNLDPDELFLPFQRGADTETKGVGLGLYIAARLAESIHGSVDVQTEDGRIAFVLRFPADETVVARLRATV